VVATRDPITPEKLWGALANEDDLVVRAMLSDGLVTSAFISWDSARSRHRN
jgi:hypothetical protein